MQSDIIYYAVEQPLSNLKKVNIEKDIDCTGYLNNSYMVSLKRISESEKYFNILNAKKYKIVNNKKRPLI